MFTLWTRGNDVVHSGSTEKDKEGEDVESNERQHKLNNSKSATGQLQNTHITHTMNLL